MQSIAFTILPIQLLVHAPDKWNFADYNPAIPL